MCKQRRTNSFLIEQCIWFHQYKSFVFAKIKKTKTNCIQIRIRKCDYTVQGRILFCCNRTYTLPVLKFKFLSILIFLLQLFQLTITNHKKCLVTCTLAPLVHLKLCIIVVPWSCLKIMVVAGCPMKLPRVHCHVWIAQITFFVSDYWNLNIYVYISPLKLESWK